jgi:hypothetical protein
MSAFIPLIGTIAAAIVTAVFGIVSYRRQKQTDREVELRNRRMKEYESYLAAYSATFAWVEEGSSEEKEAQRAYWKAYSTLFHIASDRVLLAVTDFHRFAWKQETELTGEAWDQEFKNLYAAMIIEMRKDAFQETKLPKELVEERLPFNL